MDHRPSPTTDADSAARSRRRKPYIDAEDRRLPAENAVAWVLFALLVAGATVSILMDWAEPAHDQTEPADVAASAAVTAGSPPSFTIAATGDLLIHESVAAAARTADGWDFSPMFTSVAPALSAADLAVCHLETPLSPDNSRLSYYPSFIVPRELADAIARTGYDTCSLASNHATDAGREGVAGTIAALDRARVAHAGMALSQEDRERITLVESGDATVAHLSYTYGFNNGPLPDEEAYLSNVIDEDEILAEARLARSEGADFVILSMHWGRGYDTAPDDIQTDLGPRLLASPDIDLILGHHAHVVQPVAEIDGEFLVYGLGNFLSNQSPETCSMCPPGTQDGVIVHLTVTLDEVDGRWRVSDISHTPTWVDRSTYEIIDLLGDGDRIPAASAESAQRTASALGSLGVPVKPH